MHMNRARSTASRARQRHALSIAVPAFAAGASIAAGVALLVVIADRLIGLSLEWWMPVLGVIASGLLWGVWAVARRSLSQAGAAALIDERLRLHDRISSALELADRAEDDPFAAMAMEEGERAAEGADVRGAIPIPVGREQAAWPILTAAAVALVVYAPRFDLFGAHKREQQAFIEASYEDQTRADLQQAGQLIDELAQTGPGQSDTYSAEEEARDLLEELDRQLTEKQISPDEARSKASGALAEAAQQATENAMQEAQREETLRELVAKAAERDSAGETGSEGQQAARALQEALAAGELGDAREALEALERLPEEQRELAAEELEQLAEQLKQLAEAEEQRAQELAREQLEQLRDAGFDEETAQQISEMRDQQQIEETLRERGADEESAERLAEQADTTNHDRELKEQAGEDARELAEGAEQTARELREQTPEEGQGAQGEQQQEVSAEGSEGEEVETGQPAQQGEEGTDGGQQQGEGAPQQQPGAQEGEQGAQQEVMQEGEGEEMPTGGAPRESGEGDEGQGDLHEMLERMEGARERREADSVRAEELREEAERMLDDMSPEQREELERWAGQQLIEDGGARGSYEYSTDTVDARTETEGMEVRDEWFNPDGQIVRDGAVSREEMIESLRTAAEGVERAIEEQRVPARYKNVRKYFERALERAESAEESTSPEGALGDG